MEYYSAIERNEILIQATIWLNLEKHFIIISELINKIAGYKVSVPKPTGFLCAIHK